MFRMRRLQVSLKCWTTSSKPQVRPPRRSPQRAAMLLRILRQPHRLGTSSPLANRKPARVALHHRQAPTWRSPWALPLKGARQDGRCVQAGMCLTRDGDSGVELHLGRRAFPSGCRAKAASVSAGPGRPTESWLLGCWLASRRAQSQASADRRRRKEVLCRPATPRARMSDSGW